MKKQENNLDLAAMMADEKEVKTELAPGYVSEEILPVYFDADALREPPYRIFRLDSEGYRYYYRFNEEGTPEFYPSVTTMLKAVMPTSPFLIKWIAENGRELADMKRDLAASYGTFMHTQFERLIVGRRYDFEDTPALLSEYMEQENIPTGLFNEWLVKVRKDVLAFAQFMKDYRVRPLAIEIGLVHPEYHYAGCLDLPCIMTDPKTKKEFAAIVDFKSGRKGFWEEHELQLGLYREMWNVNFPGVEVERIFNFSPKDWRKGPTYNLKEQTDSPNLKKLPYLLALAAIEDEKKDNTLTIVRGVVDLDNGDPADNILTLSLAELIKAKAETAHEPKKRPVSEDINPNGGNPQTDPYRPVETDGIEKDPFMSDSKKSDDGVKGGLFDENIDF